MRGQEIVFETLNRLGIVCDGQEHEAVFTIEEMERLDMPEDVEIAKNLFLRDAKGKRHFLVCLRKDKQADLRRLGELLRGGRLSFASEERLRRHLGLEKGSVSPLGVLNDADVAVEVVFDEDLRQCRRVGVHPNDNTATLYLSPAELERIVGDRGNPLRFIKL